MNALQAVQLLALALDLARSAGVNMDRFQAMRAASPTGQLTPEQLKELADEARLSVGKL
jgi:hypothetical protein